MTARRLQAAAFGLLLVAAATLTWVPAPTDAQLAAADDDARGVVAADTPYGWLSLSAGAAHTCMVGEEERNVWCVGTSSDGAVGDGGSAGTTHVLPQPVTLQNKTVFAASSVSAGADHTCAVEDPGGQILCWGSDGTGQLGNGPAGGQTRAGPVIQASTAPLAGVAVSAGGGVSCALDLSSEVWCWGDSTYGQVGDGSEGLTRHRGQQVDVGGGAALVASQVVAGYFHSCAVRASDQVLLCWGADNVGQVTASGAAGGNVTTPAEVHVGGTPLTVSAVALGAAHTCAARATDGQVLCWGANQWGQLGFEADGGTHGPTAVAVDPVTGGAAHLSGAYANTCAVESTGRARCWGENSDGQLSDGTTGGVGPSDVVVQPSFPSFAQQVSAGGTHTCLRDGAGLVRCAGANSGGQLGDGTTDPQLTASMVPLVPPRPTGVSVTCVSGCGALSFESTLRVSWDTPVHPLVDQYQVLYCQGGGCNPAPLATVDDTVSSYDHAGRSTASTHRYQVRGFTSEGVGSIRSVPVQE